MHWGWLMLGVGMGLLLAVPVVGVWNRRASRRMRRLEARAREAGRFAELGRLSGGLAHEIKNPLSTVSLNLQLLREDVVELASGAHGGDERWSGMRRRLDTLLGETQRLRDILDDFLRFAGRMELDRTACDVDELVRELVDFFEPQAAESGVQLSAALSHEPAIAWADAGLVKQALLNLLLNAVQAMTGAREKGLPHGGARRLTVSVEGCQAPAGPDASLADSLSVGVEERGYGWVCVRVVDDGPGIEPGAREQIFEPYFSRRRGGTGLGLATARRIAREHGGWLRVESEVGVGSRFELGLPGVVPSETGARGAATGGRDGWRGVRRPRVML